MLKMIMTGGMLLGILSCKPPTIKEPIKMYAVGLRFSEAGQGYKNLDITSDGNVGEWIDEIDFIPLHEAPTNMMCFSMRDWLLQIKPKLIEGNEYYHDRK